MIGSSRVAKRSMSILWYTTSSSQADGRQRKVATSHFKSRDWTGVPNVHKWTSLWNEKLLSIRGYMDELKIKLFGGIQLRRVSTRVHVQFTSITTDTRAQVMIKRVKYHRRYYSFNWFTDCGCSLPGRVVFAHNNSRRKTDVVFGFRRQLEHHIRDSPFEETSVDMLWNVPTHYIHMLPPGITTHVWYTQEGSFIGSQNWMNIFSTNPAKSALSWVGYHLCRVHISL